MVSYAVSDLVEYKETNIVLFSNYIGGMVGADNAKHACSDTRQTERNMLMITKHSPEGLKGQVCHEYTAKTA